MKPRAEYKSDGEYIEELTKERDEALAANEALRVENTAACLRTVAAQNRAAEARAEVAALKKRIHDSCQFLQSGERVHAGGRVVCGQCHGSEVTKLKSEVETLRAGDCLAEK